MTYRNTSFLFTGDAEEKSGGEMLLQSRTQLTSDVLKVGHHDSSSSTSAGFIKAVSPKYAVISVGKDNTYGHPHVETMQRLNDAGISIFQTSLYGTIQKVTERILPLISLLHQLVLWGRKSFQVLRILKM